MAVCTAKGDMVHWLTHVLYTHVYRYTVAYTSTLTCPSPSSHSPTYLPDFVLHGTSEPVHSFQPKLEKHLASMVKVRL